MEKRPPAKVGVLGTGRHQQSRRSSNAAAEVRGQSTVSSFLLDGVGLVLAQPLGVLGDALPAEGQAPVKVPAVGGVAVGHRLVELEVVQVDGNDLGADHGGRLLHDARQQGLQPPVEALTCAGEQQFFSLAWRTATLQKN